MNSRVFLNSGMVPGVPFNKKHSDLSAISCQKTVRQRTPFSAFRPLSRAENPHVPGLAVGLFLSRLLLLARRRPDGHEEFGLPARRLAATDALPFEDGGHGARPEKTVGATGIESQCVRGLLDLDVLFAGKRFVCRFRHRRRDQGRPRIRRQD